MLAPTRAIGLPAILGLLAAAGLAAPAPAGSNFALVGWDDLVARLGEGNVPTGATVIVGQVEGLQGAAYGPNQSNAEFVGKTFIPHDGNPGSHNHATTVGRNMYGLLTSIAPGITDIHLFEAGGWAGQSGWLGTNPNSSGIPAAPPEGMRIINNSWVGCINFGQGCDAEWNNDALRRADFWANLHDVLMIGGVNNGGASNEWLLSHWFNGLAVGKLDGDHETGNTQAPLDGPGRLKPEITAPGNATSWSTPVVSAGAALLVETARTAPNLMGNPRAERSEVLKAILMAGATHDDSHGQAWTNNAVASGPERGVTTQPIDDIVGAGLLNINIAHLILTGGELDGATIASTAPSAPAAGWDLAPFNAGQSRFWRFSLDEEAGAVSILMTWHRRVRIDFNDYFHGDFDLTLWRVDEGGQLVSLVGDAGLSHFAGGNCVSQSAVDNVEHLHLTGLAAGAYVLELSRSDTEPPVNWDAAVAWHVPGAVLASEPADLNGDGMVNAADLAVLLGAWSVPSNVPGCDGALPCEADLNGDSFVNAADLAILLGSWG